MLLNTLHFGHIEIILQSGEIPVVKNIAGFMRCVKLYNIINRKVLKELLDKGFEKRNDTIFKAKI